MHFTSQKSNTLFRPLHGLPDLRRRGSAFDVVNDEYRVESENFEDVLIKRRMDLLQLFEGQILQFASAFDRELHRLTDGFVRQARRDAAFDQKSRRRPGMHESRLCG